MNGFQISDILNLHVGLLLMFSFNGRTDGDSKKCWPLDVAVLEDGTPVVTDFHNKKIKAFDATGTVMGEVNFYRVHWSECRN